MLVFPNVISNPLLYPKTVMDRVRLTWNIARCYPCRRKFLYEGMSDQSHRMRLDTGVDEESDSPRRRMRDALLYNDVAESGGDECVKSMSSLNFEWQRSETKDASLLSSWWFKLG
jgi:hypothetical protein